MESDQIRETIPANARTVGDVNRRWMVLAGALGVGLATAGAAFATNAAFSSQTDTAPASAVAGLSTVPEVTDATRSSVADPDDGRDRQFRVDDAGTVVLRATRRDLEIVRVRVRPGWTASEPEETTINGTPKVEVEFTRGTEHLEFVALLLDGDVVPRINREDEGHAATEPDESDAPDSSGTAPNDDTDDTDDTDDDTSSSVDDDDSDDDDTDDDDGPEPPEPTEAPEPTEPTEAPEPPEPPEH